MGYNNGEDNEDIVGESITVSYRPGGSGGYIETDDFSGARIEIDFDDEIGALAITPWDEGPDGPKGERRSSITVLYAPGAWVKAELRTEYKPQPDAEVTDTSTSGIDADVSTVVQVGSPPPGLKLGVDYAKKDTEEAERFVKPMAGLPTDRGGDIIIPTGWKSSEPKLD